MKTLKVVLVAALVSFTMMSMAQSNECVNQRVISLEKAITIPHLNYAMHQQIDLKSFLGEEREGLYVAKVLVQGKFFFVSGTYTQWYNFLTSRLEFIPREIRIDR